jgi:alkylation response protein AidB-like acyl-CoA dehydrogenase
MNPILERLDGLTEIFQARAAALDAEMVFPAENIADLARIGALAAPIPRALGGLGAGTQADGAPLLHDILRAIGRAHLPTGRLFEAHVNALRLIAVYGTHAQLADAAADARQGLLFGLWVTDGDDPLRIEGAALQGGKSFCSGAGHVRRALVTAQPPQGDPLLVIVRLDESTRARPAALRLQGMRAAVTGAMHLGGLPATPAEIVGRPGDYLRQPEFSAGAWRTSAVTLGGIEALSLLVRRELTARGRSADPHQLARVGQLLIAQETAMLWSRKSIIAEADDADPGDRAQYVNLARLAIEAASLDILRLAQRSLGLAAFVAGHPAEILLRDLATYLRQPAPDITLTEAAAFFIDRPLP